MTDILEQIATWLETVESKGGAPMPPEEEYHYEDVDDFIRGMEWAAAMVRKYKPKDDSLFEVGADLMRQQAREIR